MNLVTNAVEAISNSGEITIITENLYVDKNINGFDEVKQGSYVTFIIKDTGVGIYQQDIERIFEPFYTKKVMGKSGTGLGMAVVWGTVKDHNGYIDVKSTPGVGTSFSLYFPVTMQALLETDPSFSLEKIKGKGERILIVDDVEEQIEIASSMLSKLGYSIASALSGEEALEYLRKDSANLIVLDMILEGGMDGLDTYKKILEIKPGQKAIIASGFSETERVKEAQRLGVRQYLKKPYLLEKIGRAVKEALDS
jgi:CheY-like chemotaxis protein